jgi:tetratricopeptide (TPR) repeat protein
MASERVQRQIDRLLDEAEAAFDANDWATVAERARKVLLLDEQNEDAATFLAAAEAGSTDVVGTAPAALRETSFEAREPASFADGRYAVERFLGEGGKKKVYLAHDTLLDRDVAFALIKTEGLDAVGRERIVREAQAMGRLGAHPHIVSIFDLGEHEGQPYVVTELMGGGDVEGLLDQAAGPLPLEQSLAISTSVAQGLVFAHDKGVVHRDLKPGNVWLTADGVAKIGDFGLAVALDKSRLTMHGMMVGTVAYMPPEQALGGDVTPQADLYSLGAMLYEMVTGRPPFAGSEPTALISQHINTPPVAPSWQTDGCPAALEELILELLAKAPSDRPGSAAVVLARLQAIDPAAPGVRHGDSGSNPLDRLAKGVFVGREAELDRLRAAFDEAFAGRGSLVMLVGEPGIGKTRTAQELATYAQLRGGRVLWGRARESAGAPPYWPWVQIGNAFSASTDITQGGTGVQYDMLAALVPLFPALRQLIPGLPELPELHDGEAAQFRLFEAYTRFVAQIADPPLLLVLDDLHWADKPSLLLLEHLAQELAHLRALVVGTYRDTDLARTHPLSEALATLNREPGFLRVPLRGLTRDETAAYIRAAANVEPAAVVLDRIVEETEGNPFFLSEVVNLLTQEGTLAKTSLSDIAIPDGVREALGRRLDRISPETNETLQVAAVVGREFAYDTLTLLGARPDDELLTQVEEALDARVIEELDRPGRYRFTHALMQETLLSELSTTRRVRLHGQVGDALEKRWAANAERHAPELAVHFSEAATLSAPYAQRAVRYSRLAAEQAEAVAAWDDARRHYQRCLDLIADDDEGHIDEDDAALLVHLGRCSRDSGDFRGAARAFNQAIECYQARGDGRAVAQTTLDALLMGASPERVEARVRNALDVLAGADPHLEALLILELASPTQAVDLRTPADRARLARLVEMHDFDDVRIAQDFAEATLSTHGLDVGDETLLRLRTAYEFLDRRGQPGQAAVALSILGIVMYIRGDLAAMESANEELGEYARKHGLRYIEGMTVGNACGMMLLRGDLAGAGALEAEVSGSWSAVFTQMGAVSLRLLLEGRIEEAVAALPDANLTPQLPAGLGIAVQRTEIMWAAGRPDDAAREFSRFRARFGDYELHNSRLAAMCRLAEYLGEFADDDFLDACEDLERRCDAMSQPPMLAQGWVPAGLGFGHLDLVRGRVDDAERRFADALAWSRRERCPIAEGRCHQGLAMVAERRGDHTAALEHLELAGALFARYGVKYHLDQVLAEKEVLKA